jgi:sugar phosphate isomerase/epimerase
VLHPGHGSSALRNDLKQVLPPNLEHLPPLADAAGALGIKLCIENMMDGRHRPGLRMFGSATHELLDLIERIDHPALGIVLDTSHANAQQLDIPAAIHEYGARLWATHISDNDGSGDQHRTPFNGTIDWPAVMAAFKAIGYDGLFNLEIPGERHALLPIRKLKTTWAREVAEWLVRG